MKLQCCAGIAGLVMALAPQPDVFGADDTMSTYSNPYVVNSAAKATPEAMPDERRYGIDPQPTQTTSSALQRQNAGRPERTQWSDSPAAALGAATNISNIRDAVAATNRAAALRTRVSRNSPMLKDRPATYPSTAATAILAAAEPAKPTTREQVILDRAVVSAAYVANAQPIAAELSNQATNPLRAASGRLFGGAEPESESNPLR